MRLAVAAAILVQSFPTSSSSSVQKDGSHFNTADHLGNEKTVDKRRRSLGVPINIGKEESIMIHGKTQLAKEVKTLRNQLAEFLPPIECDPTMDDGQVADVGLLSCGAGQYCAESVDSTRGGICLDVVTGQRALQDDNRTDLAIVNTVLCGLNNATCSCSGYDPQSYALEVTCVFPSKCEEEGKNCGGTVEHCFSADRTVSFMGPGLYTRSTCYTNSAPYEQNICYRGATTGLMGNITTCEMSFGGVTCNSCEVKSMYTEDCDPFGYCYYSDEPQTCYIFDCTNTAGAHSGNTCYLEGSKIFNFMDTDGCTNCELCPGGSVIFPNATVDYFWGPGYFYDLQCYQIEYALKTGFFFTAENCTYIQTGLAGVCCGVGPATLAPAFAMPDDPASAPPGSTSAGSDPIGTTMTRTTSMVLMSGIAAAAASVVW